MAVFDRIVVGGFLNNTRSTVAVTHHAARRSALVALAFATVLAACGSSEDDSFNSQPFNPPAQPPVTNGTVAGRVQSAGNGQAVSGATITIGTDTTTTGSDGSFSVADLTQTDRLAVSITAPGHTPIVRFTAVTGSTVTSVPTQLPPIAATVSLNAAAGGTATVASSTAQAVFPAGAIVTSTGTAPTQAVLVQITPIDTAQDPNLLTGDYRTTRNGAAAWLETYGGLSVALTDAASGTYNLATGQSATIRIPVSTRSTDALPSTVSLYRFDESTGLWVSDGTATLVGTAPNNYYEGTVTRAGTWTAGAPIDTVQVTGCVANINGTRVNRARVEIDGVTYSGMSSALTNTSGVFSVPMRRNATAVLMARYGGSLSNARAVSATTSTVSLGSECLIFAEGTISIKLTWGRAPLDVDSHLLTPQGTHIYYNAKGSLTVAPFANLDVDDVTSYGPEFITVRRVAQGTYRYFLHNFSNTFSPGMTASPVKVEVTHDGTTQIFTPGAGEGTLRYWNALDIVVNGQCAVTITPTNTWSATEPTNPNQNGGAVTYCN